MAINGESQEVDITPHPRILAMLGEIAFEPHKCIGELIDNAIDGFLSQPRFLQEHPKIRPKVTIRVPHKNQIGSAHAEIVVEDNGPGMTLPALTLAAKAGYSGTSSLENLGLFGMGFNIATARLGGITKLRSGVKGESAWSILDIDLAKLRSQASYIIRPRFENKPPEDSGTRVTIRNLKPEQARQIASGISGGTLKSVAGLRSWVGRTYTKYLREAEPHLADKSLEITVDGSPIKPFRWCIWGENREVEIGAETRLGVPQRIPAYKQFNFVLGVGYYCTSCLSWQPEGVSNTTQCAFCSEDTVIERSRRMKGWIGIQRHLDEDEYGLDFLRNGRAILQWDKRVFSWTHPETGKTDLEYPIDEIRRVPRGRIVGEIEIDHVPVHYQKDSFETESWLWQEVINNLRGQSPFRPQHAERVNIDLVQKHLKQVTSYAINMGCEWSILTNGQDWKLYHISFTQPPQIKLVESWNLIDDDLVILAEKFALIGYKNIKGDGLARLWEKRNVLTTKNVLKIILSEQSLKSIRHEIKKVTEITVSPEEIVGAIRRMLNQEAIGEMEKVKISLPATKQQKRRASLKDLRKSSKKLIKEEGEK